MFDIGKDPTPLRTVADVQEVLERTVHETLVLVNSPERNRVIGSLLMIALKALEVGELEARIAALEQQTGRRSVA